MEAASRKISKYFARQTSPNQFYCQLEKSTEPVLHAELCDCCMIVISEETLSKSTEILSIAGCQAEYNMTGAFQLSLRFYGSIKLISCNLH